VLRRTRSRLATLGAALAFAGAQAASLPARAEGAVRTEGGATDGAAAEARALELFDESERAYENGRFQDAVDLLRRSYALKREPVVLYNLARAYEGLGDSERAVGAYEDYLKAQPETKDRASIEQRVATLRRQIAARAAQKKREAQPPPRRPSAVPWVITGVGAAGVVAGVILEIFALKRHGDANEEPSQVRSESEQRQAQSLSTASSVSLVVGGAIATAGLLWGIVDVSTSGASRAAVAVGPGGLALRVRTP
jgi:tetratricopeptide (TPR) repeat protein